MSPEERVHGSNRILTHLLEWHSFVEARCVLLYAPFVNEPDLLSLLEMKFEKSKIFCFPRVHGNELRVHQVQQIGQLIRSENRIREPDPHQCRELALEAIDLAIIPGLAFSELSGIRLGRGAGYYDRMLSEDRFHALATGVCFENQLQTALPTETHDMPMQVILTPQGVIELPSFRSL